MLPGFNEVVVEYDFPLRVHELAMAESHECIARSGFAS